MATNLKDLSDGNGDLTSSQKCEMDNGALVVDFTVLSGGPLFREMKGVLRILLPRIYTYSGNITRVSGGAVPH